MAGYAPNSSHQDFAVPPKPTALDFQPPSSQPGVHLVFLQIQSDILFGHERKIKTLSIT